MSDNEIQSYLDTNELTLCKDNIIRDKKGHPKCPNAIFQPLLEMVQDNQKHSYFQSKIYGCLIMSLAEIVLNNKIMRFQDPDIKDEARGEMYFATVDALPKFFKRDKGSAAYSYAFRIQYTTCVHVLQRHNRDNEIIERLRKSYEEMIEGED